MVLHVFVHLADETGVVRTIRIQPEDGLGTRFSRTSDSQLDPIFDGRVLGLAHAPDVSFVHLVLQMDFVCVQVANTDGTFRRNFKSLVVRTVFLKEEGEDKEGEKRRRDINREPDMNFSRTSAFMAMSPTFDTFPVTNKSSTDTP
jgi:hypothetical protein